MSDKFDFTDFIRGLEKDLKVPEKEMAQAKKFQRQRKLLLRARLRHDKMVRLQQLGQLSLAKVYMQIVRQKEQQGSAEVLPCDPSFPALTTDAMAASQGSLELPSVAHSNRYKTYLRQADRKMFSHNYDRSAQEDQITLHSVEEMLAHIDPVPSTFPPRLCCNAKNRGKS